MSSSSSQTHRRESARQGPLTVAVVTVSDTRTAETDRSGQYLQEAIRLAGNQVSTYQIVPDEPDQLQQCLKQLAEGTAQVIILNGGTGLSLRDSTFEVVSGLLEKTIPGFGEIFRKLSFDEIGAAAILSRAVAGVYRGRILVSLPGSPAAVRLAWQRLLEPELPHLVWEVGR